MKNELDRISESTVDIASTAKQQIFHFSVMQSGDYITELTVKWPNNYRLPLIIFLNIIAK